MEPALLLEISLIFWWKSKIRRQPDHVALGAEDRGLIGIAQPRRGLDHHGKHRLQIEGRAADDLQHVAGRGLVFQRFLKIGGAGLQRAIRLGAGDGDHRLFGEHLQKLNLRWREFARLSPCDINRTDRFSVPHQGNGRLSTNTSPKRALSQRIGLIGRDVG